MRELKKETVTELKKKGWNDEEIMKADRIIVERMQKDKSGTTTYMNKAVFWTMFFIMIIGNFIISILMIPFLLVLNLTFLDFIIVVLGVSFGFLFNFLITDIRHVPFKHHLFAGTVIPIVAVLNFFFMTSMANSLANYLQVSNVRQDPYTISIIYMIAFIAPYLVDRIREYYEEKSLSSL